MQLFLDCVWAKLNICNGDCARVQLIVNFDHLQIVYPVNYHFAKDGAIQNTPGIYIIHYIILNRYYIIVLV